MTRLALLAAAMALALLAQPAVESSTPAVSSYVLGPGDQLSIRALEVEEINDKPFRVEANGFINLPLVGRFKASGMSIEQLEVALTKRLKQFVREPNVAVNILEFRSQPISILGAVNKPGVHQLQGRKTLIEVLSLAEGLKNEAGFQIKITRSRKWGRIPLPNAIDDPTGQYTVAEVNVKSLMAARKPAENILIMPDDVISVPRADLVYVIGAVKKSGGFVLGEKENVTVLQALSMAEGLDRVAASKSARILRPQAGQTARLEIPVDVKKILAGQSPDVALKADDILFIPTSGAKSALLRGTEAAIQIGTGVVIWRR